MSKSFLLSFTLCLIFSLTVPLCSGQGSAREGVLEVAGLDEVTVYVGDRTYGSIHSSESVVRFRVPLASPVAITIAVVVQDGRRGGPGVIANLRVGSDNYPTTADGEPWRAAVAPEWHWYNSAPWIDPFYADACEWDFPESSFVISSTSSAAGFSRASGASYVWAKGAPTRNVIVLVRMVWTPNAFDVCAKTLSVRVDNYYSVYHNEKLIGGTDSFLFSSEANVSTWSSWTVAQSFDILNAKVGDVITVEARFASGGAGLVARFDMNNRRHDTKLGKGPWRARMGRNVAAVENWRKPSYDDCNWDYGKNTADTYQIFFRSAEWGDSIWCEGANEGDICVARLIIGGQVCKCRKGRCRRVL